MRVFALIAVLAVASGAAASTRSPQPRTVVTTKARITRFAQDGRWIAWTTEKTGCDLTLHIRSLATGRAVSSRVAPPMNCIDGNTDQLALAGDRALWGTLLAATDGEFRVMMTTMRAGSPHPRHVETMVMERGPDHPDPAPPPVAGRGKVLVYYRQDDFAPRAPLRTVNRLFASGATPTFPAASPVALAVDGTRVASAREQPVGDELWAAYEIHGVDGRLLMSGQTLGVPLGIALAGPYMAILAVPIQTGQKLLTIVGASGARTVEIAANAREFISARDGNLVFAAGHSIWLVNLTTAEQRIIANAKGAIVGVAISGRRVTWAEDTPYRTSRIKTLLLPPA